MHVKDILEQPRTSDFDLSCAVDVFLKFELFFRFFVKSPFLGSLASVPCVSLARFGCPSEPKFSLRPLRPHVHPWGEVGPRRRRPTARVNGTRPPTERVTREF